MQEMYEWHAHYQDGGELFEEDAQEGFASVDQSRILALELRTEARATTPTVFIPPGAQAVFFRRRSLVISPGDGSQAPGYTIHCIGWRRGEDAAYLFVKDDGNVILTNDLQWE